MRGKPGSAPPFDLDRGTKGLQKVAGRMTSVCLGHTGPSVGKKKEVSKVGQIAQRRARWLIAEILLPSGFL